MKGAGRNGIWNENRLVVVGDVIKTYRKPCPSQYFIMGSVNPGNRSAKSAWSHT